jgi:predicted transcriptional regulator
VELEAAIARGLEAGEPQAAIARQLGITKQAVQARAAGRETAGGQRRSEVKSSSANGLDSADQPKS